MAVFFTSDHHFGHMKIIEHCRRPFADVDHMNHQLVRRWNEVVGPDDEVWHLGDFAYRCHPRTMANLFNSLNGRKHLVTGNHDNGATCSLRWASRPVPYAELSLAIGDDPGNPAKLTPFILFHYGMRVWNQKRRGAIHLYGHSHDRLPDLDRSCDVGVDSWDYRPVGIQQLLARLPKPSKLNPENSSGEETSEGEATS